MRILVIKLAALGDVVLAFAAMQRIRKAHAGAHIALLTTPPFEALARESGLFDEIWTDGRPKGLLPEIAMLRRLRRAKFSRVYDLQTSSRSSRYFYGLLPKPPEWSGIAFGASHPHANPNRDQMHTLERQAIKAVAHDVIDLTGKTDIAQVAALGALAQVAVGNDTGPTHLIAAAGAPTVVVFSGDSDPALCAPRGRRVCVLQRPLLSDLDLNTVLDAVASVSAP